MSIMPPTKRLFGAVFLAVCSSRLNPKFMAPTNQIFVSPLSFDSCFEKLFICADFI